MGVVTITIFVACICFVIALLIESAYKKPRNFPPGPPSLPHFGAYLTFRSLDMKNLGRSFAKLGRYYETNVLGMYANATIPLVIANSYDTIREFYYNTDFDGRVDMVVARARAFNKLLGIFFTDGIYWHIQRRFSLRYLRDFGFGRRCQTLEGVLENGIKEMFDLRLNGPKYDFEKEVVKGDNVNLPYFFTPVFINGILEVLTSTPFDRKDNYKLYNLAKGGLQFQRCSDDLGGAISLFPYLTKLFPKWSGYKDLTQSSAVFIRFYEEILKDIERSHNISYDRHFVDMYLRRMKEEIAKKGKSTFSHEQLLITCIDYTFPASTANAQILMMAIDHMLVNPSIQEKVHEEIDRVVGRNRVVTLDDRKDLHYTEAVIRETLRYETMVTMALPHRAMQDTQLAGFHVPKNSVVSPNMLVFHHDKEVWGDPENFRPERFIVDGKLCLKKDKSLPFGAGKRLCAGETYARQSMFQVFSCLMQAFELSPADGKAQTKHLKRIPGIIVTLPDFWVKLTPRT